MPSARWPQLTSSSGAFSTYAGKAKGPTVGRALGWLWWAQIVVVVAAEATAAAQLVTEMWLLTAPVGLGPDLHGGLHRHQSGACGHPG